MQRDKGLDLARFSELTATQVPQMLMREMGEEAVASSRTRTHSPTDFKVLLYHPKGLDEVTL